MNRLVLIQGLLRLLLQELSQLPEGGQVERIKSDMHRAFVSVSQEVDRETKIPR